ncbi:metallopeptidase family protein [Nocardioides marmoriginsengisoli]|nr:metallopeptidase family protein [Nocardioides marmoriginsengisoli]
MSSRIRDRHDRGMRGPAFGKGPWAPKGVPAARTRSERFDDIALRVMRVVVAPWLDRLGDLELAVEEVPVIPAGWSNTSVPLASYVEKSAAGGPRLVLFRRPLEHRAEGVLELETLLLTVIVEQVAEVLGIPAEDVHPGYEAD